MTLVFRFFLEFVSKKIKIDAVLVLEDMSPIQNALLSWANTFLDAQVDTYDQLADGHAIATIADQMYVTKQNLYLFFFCILFLVCSQPSQKIINDVHAPTTMYTPYSLNIRAPLFVAGCIPPILDRLALIHYHPRPFPKKKKKNDFFLTTL